MGYQNALLCATEYRRCESRLTGVEPRWGVTPLPIANCRLKEGVAFAFHVGSWTLDVRRLCLPRPMNVERPTSNVEHREIDLPRPTIPAIPTASSENQTA